MSRYFRQLAKRAMEEQQAAQDLAVTEEVIVNIEEEVIEEEDAVRKIEGEMFQRALVTDFRAAGEERTIEFPFASEAPVERYFGMEVLSMDESAMDLSRLNDGAPLLFQHDPDRDRRRCRACLHQRQARLCQGQDGQQRPWP
jgi:hypothetical protein